MRRTLILVTLVSLAGLAWAGDDIFRPVNFTFHASLSGDQEVPPFETRTSGDARFKLRGERIDYVLRIRNGNDILSVAGAHIHCGVRGNRKSPCAQMPCRFASCWLSQVAMPWLCTTMHSASKGPPTGVSSSSPSASARTSVRLLRWRWTVGVDAMTGRHPF